jgi:CIC family chloride channel protein
VFGARAFLELPPFHLTALSEYALYAGLGLIAAVAGVAFIRTLYGLEDLVDHVWRGPEWLRPAVGGIVLGVLLLLIPQMYGVGYPVLERAIVGQYALGLLLLFLVGKILATSLTIAIGGSGGVFAPSLFIGAMLGTAYGIGVQTLVPGVHGPPGAYGVVGMGAVFAAAARAPMTAVIILFELTGDYQIILPLMFAIALATAGSRLLSGDTIYTLKLRRRGIELRRGQPGDVLDVLRVRDAMRPLPLAIPFDARPSDVVSKLAEAEADALPVVDADGHYRGVITARQLESVLADPTSDATVGALVEQPPTLRTLQSLTQAVPLLLRGDSAGLPVLDEDEATVVGWLTHRSLLQTYHARAQNLRPARAQPPPSPPLGATPPISP